MEFFTRLHSLNVDSIHVVIKQDKTGKMTVSLCSISSINDSAINSIPPISLTNTPDKLDEDFFEIITKPIQEQQVLITNLKTYHERLENAKENNAQEQEKKAKLKKYIERIKTIESEPNFDVKIAKDRLLEVITKIEAVDSQNKFAKEKKAEIIKKCSMQQLF